MNDLQIAMSRTWAEINLDNLEHNIKTLRKLLNPDTKFLGVCKADFNHAELILLPLRALRRARNFAGTE